MFKIDEKGVKSFFISLLTLLLIGVFILGCENSTKNKKESSENAQQDRFVSFMKKNCDAYEKMSNDIQKNEFYSLFENELVKLSDTLGVFTNWKGTIKNIQIYDWGSSKATQIKADIELKHSEGKILKLKCEKYFNKNEIDSNLTYRQLKTLSNGSIVYFDGFLARNKDKKVDIEKTFSIGANEICEPAFKFHIISITNEKLEFTSQDNFKQAIQIQTQVMQAVDERANKKISEMEFTKRVKDFKKQLDNLNVLFTKEQKAYFQSYTDCLVSQLYAN
jgi:hypothetical protein